VAEVLVLGGGVGGLSAAIYARLNGHEVRLVEKGSAVGGKAAPAASAGFTLDPGPTIVILERLYRRMFEDAGRHFEDYLVFDRLDPIARVYFEGQAPVDLPADREACLQTLAAVAPEDASSLRSLLRKLDVAAPAVDRSIFSRPYHRPWQLVDAGLAKFGLQFDPRATYKELVDNSLKSPLLRAFFYGFPSYGGQTYDAKAPGAFMIPYLMITEGVFYPRGGVRAIPAALERLARELGVEIRTGVEVTGLEASVGRVTAAVTSEGSMTAEKFICNVDRSTARRWLGSGEDRRPSLSYFTLQWTFPHRVEDLSHHTLLVPQSFERGFEALYRRRQVPDDPIVYINFVDDAQSVPSGGSAVLAVATSPAMEPEIDWRKLRPQFRDRIVRQFERHGLHLDPEAAESERIQDPPYFEQAHGNHRGSLYGPDEAYRLFKLFPERVVDQQFGNLFYAGATVQPGAGLPMVLLSGKFAADLL
jgi:phytoene desaturase